MAQAIQTVQTHTLGFPRMGAQRELKFALERHWRGELGAEALEALGAELEHPFGLAANDLALGSLCYTIESSVLEMVGEPPRTAKPEVRDCILL